MPIHTLSRRQFAALGLSSFAAFTLSGRLLAEGEKAGEPAPSPFFAWTEPLPGLFVGSEGGGNVLVLGNGTESFLIDTKNPGLGATLKREAAARAGRISTVILTHHHRDHVGGVSAFTKDSAVVSHTAARQRILDQVDAIVAAADATFKGLDNAPKPTPKEVRDEIEAFIEELTKVSANDFAPTRTVEKDGETLKIAGHDIVLRHLGPGHTDNDIAVYLPESNVLHTGDLLFHKLHPFVDRPAGATTKGWQSVLKALHEMCNDRTIVVPGHGEVTNRAAIQAQIDYFDKMREAVTHAKNVESMTKIEVSTLMPGAFADYGFKQILPRVLTAIYEEIEEGV